MQKTDEGGGVVVVDACSPLLDGEHSPGKLFPIDENIHVIYPLTPPGRLVVPEDQRILLLRGDIPELLFLTEKLPRICVALHC